MANPTGSGGVGGIGGVTTIATPSDPATPNRESLSDPRKDFASRHRVKKTVGNLYYDS